MTLQELIAGLFGGQGSMQPAPVAGPTPNDLIMKSLGAGSPAPVSAEMPRADSTRVTQTGLAPVAPNPPPKTNAAPEQTSSHSALLPQSVPDPGVFDRMGALAEGYGGGGLIGGIANMMMAPDAQVRARREALAQNNRTFQVLRKQGLPEDDAAMLIGNPKLLQEVLQSKYKQPERQIKEVFDEATGRKRMGSIDPATGDYLPVGGLEAQAPGSVGNGPFKDTKERAGVEEGLRKEVTAVTKDWSVIRDAHAKIKAVGAQPQSPASDMAIVFGIMKLYDPNSVVRESEYATAENAGAAPDKVWNLYNKIKEGYRLTPAQRADFLGQADVLAQSQAQRTKQVMEHYKGIAERLGVDVRNVILDDPDAVGGIGQKPPQGPPPAAPAAAAPDRAPQPGAVMDGYRFKGGDPANPQSWERVQ